MPHKPTHKKYSEISQDLNKFKYPENTSLTAKLRYRIYKNTIENLEKLDTKKVKKQLNAMDKIINIMTMMFQIIKVLSLILSLINKL